jgi:hypothetical protein
MRCRVCNYSFLNRPAGLAYRASFIWANGDHSALGARIAQ